MVSGLAFVQKGRRLLCVQENRPVCLWGEKDGLFTLATARAMAAELPNARLEVLPGVGHAIHIECPRQLAAALQRFRRAAAPHSAATPASSPSSI